MEFPPSVHWYMSSSRLVWLLFVRGAAECVLPIGLPMRRHDRALKSCQATSAAQRPDGSAPDHNQSRGRHVFTTSRRIRGGDERGGDDTRGQLSPSGFKRQTLPPYWSEPPGHMSDHGNT
ncbi:unnamed protein product [Pleuronectes platessa]|uniref:Uncharacterized protein n=1 Tax=Pleuronectes platessa TaxID=8262 RepID=A0A9N7UQZ9_PLEPL|nr:unnamed protein product [Pleuronectes platessa]